jgi:hypothetical protein
VTDQDPKLPPARNAALLRSLLPSLVILVGVFFFISSACFSDGDSGYDYSCPEAVDSTSPPNASAQIVQPQLDQVFAGAGADGLIEVPVSLRAGVVVIADGDVCQRGSGHFVLFVERVAGEGCVDPSTLQGMNLLAGETETVLRLAPGRYALKAQVFTSAGIAYQPEIADTVQFIVDGPAPAADGGSCL